MATQHEKKELQLSVDNYISETLSYISTVQGFHDKKSEWLCKREEEMNKMKDIRKKTNDMKLKLSIRMKKLEKELSAVVKDVISGLKELQPFLEALEKLVVTSPFVFDERLCWFPPEITVTDVISFIHAARMSCGLLVYFKKDTEKIFQPNLVNVEILASELQRMIGFSKDICEIMEKRGKNTCLKINPDMSPDTVNMMITHVNDLSKIRANEDFRLTFIFGDKKKSLTFIDVFSKQKPKILGSLAEMEACAVQLDRMKKGANISGVAGSTVGVGGGVVSIVGLALAPVTLGASSILILVGGVMGAVSAVNSVTTGITEAAINYREKKNFSEIYQKFLEDLEPIYKCLDQVIIIKGPSVENDIVDHMRNAGKAGGAVSNVFRTVDAALDCSRVMKFTDAVSDFAEIGGVAKAAPTALSVPFRAAFIAGNSALIGLDLFFIVNNSISLANGSKSDISKAIQGHVDFWKIHLDAWERICDSLLRGQQDFQESKTILEKPFYPEL